MKVGENVKIIDRLYPTMGNSIIDDMFAYTGAETTITKVCDDDFYTIGEDRGRYVWHHTLLMPLREPIFNKGDKVRIVTFEPNAINMAASEMMEYINSTVEVVDPDYHGFVMLKDSEWKWHPLLLKTVEPYVAKSWWPKHFSPKPKM